MKTQIQLYPDNLVDSQFHSLTKYLNRAASHTPNELLAEANRHVNAAADAYRKNRLVNLRLAMAIRDVIKKLTTTWDEQPEVARPWLAAAILYSAMSAMMNLISIRPSVLKTMSKCSTPACDLPGVMIFV